MPAADHPWIEYARAQMHVREVKGPKHAAEIVQYWRDIRRGGIKDDETPWCAAFVGACLERVGIVSTRFEGARSYTDWGQKLDKPAVGCVVVLNKLHTDQVQHVAFVVGQDAVGNLLCLGGNQADAVNVAAFARSQGRAYRWPPGHPLPALGLPVMAAAAFAKSVA